MYHLLHLRMDVKEYLLTTKAYNLAEIARRMWPRNAGAKNYLSAKLNGSGGRSFTRKDAINAKRVLAELGMEANYLTVADKY